MRSGIKQFTPNLAGCQTIGAAPPAIRFIYPRSGDAAGPSPTLRTSPAEPSPAEITVSLVPDPSGGGALKLFAGRSGFCW